MWCFSRYSRQKCHNQGFWSKTAVVNRPTTKMLIFLASTVLSPHSLKPSKPKRSAKIDEEKNPHQPVSSWAQLLQPIIYRNYIWSKNISISSEGCFFISSTNGWWAEYNAFSARIKEITRWNRIWLYLRSRKQTFLVIDYNNTCFNSTRLCLSASSKILVAFSGVTSFWLKAALQRWNYKFISIERTPVHSKPTKSWTSYLSAA